MFSFGSWLERGRSHGGTQLLSEGSVLKGEDVALARMLRPFSCCQRLTLAPGALPELPGWMKHSDTRGLAGLLPPPPRQSQPTGWVPRRALGHGDAVPFAGAGRDRTRGTALGSSSVVASLLRKNSPPPQQQ